jgi:hypothetical protein
MVQYSHQNFIKIHHKVLKLKMLSFYRLGPCSSQMCSQVTGRLMPDVFRHHGGIETFSTNHPVTHSKKWIPQLYCCKSLSTNEK